MFSLHKSHCSTKLLLTLRRCLLKCLEKAVLRANTSNLLNYNWLPREKWTWKGCVPENHLMKSHFWKIICVNEKKRWRKGGMYSLLYSAFRIAFNNLSLILAVDIVRAVWVSCSEKCKWNHAEPWHTPCVRRITWIINLKIIASGDSSAENKGHSLLYSFRHTKLKRTLLTEQAKCGQPRTPTSFISYSACSNLRKTGLENSNFFTVSEKN